MTNPCCKSDEHDLCGWRMRRQSGKTYTCDCPCHPIVVIEKKVVEEEDDDD